MRSSCGKTHIDTVSYLPQSQETKQDNQILDNKVSRLVIYFVEDYNEFSVVFQYKKNRASDTFSVVSHLLLKTSPIFFR